MKIVNEKGKLFGLINVVDLIVLIAIILVAGAIIWQLVGNQVNDAVSQKVELNAELVIEELHTQIVDEVIRQDLVGEQIVSGNQYYDATITAVWVEDYTISSETTSGDIIETVDPSIKQVHFTITTEVAPDSSGFKIGSQELRVGKTYIVKTQTFEYEAIVYALDVADSK